jgi:hypothetical protein
MIVRAAFSTEYDRCSARGLLWELKDLLRSNFLSFDVVHIPRSRNMAADGLAALGAGLSPGASPIIDCIPNCIRVLVANDLASFYE